MIQINLINRIFNSDNKRTATFKKNIIGSFVIRGVSILISLALVPLTLGYVSTEMYGIWLTVSSIMIWLDFFDIGFTLGLKNKLTEALALRNYELGSRLISTTYFIMFIIFIPLCLILIIITPFVNWSSFLNIGNQYNKELMHTMYLLSIFFCTKMISNVLSSVVEAFQKVALASLFFVIGNAISLLIIFILKHTVHPSLSILAIAISVPPIMVVIIASLILFNGKFKLVKPSIKKIDKSTINDLFSLGYKFFIIQVHSVVLYQSTNVLIANISGPSSVTEYNIIYKYLGVAMMIFSMILSPLWPAVTDAYIKKDYKWMQRIYKRMIYIFLLLTLVMLTMMVISKFAIHLWVGKGIEVSYNMIIMVGVFLIVHNWHVLQALMINGFGKLKLQTLVVVIGLVLHIPLSLFLGKYIGASGVILSMLIITLVYCCFFTVQINLLMRSKAKGIWNK